MVKLVLFSFLYERKSFIFSFMQRLIKQVGWENNFGRAKTFIYENNAWLNFFFIGKNILKAVMFKLGKSYVSYI